MSYKLVYTPQAKKDARKLKATPLAKEANELLSIVEEDPFADPPPFEALVGDLKGAYSRRINIQHRLVYQVLEAERLIKSFASGPTTNRDPTSLRIQSLMAEIEAGILGAWKETRSSFAAYQILIALESTTLGFWPLAAMMPCATERRR